MQICRHNISQLAQTFPVIGLFQFLFLNGHFTRQPLTQIGYGLTHRLTLLPHGISLISQGVKPIQQQAEAFLLMTIPVLPNGAESKLLGCAVRCSVVIGFAMV